ncbi:helix-turn-helix transcriptional regulator [Streptomyces sp. MI02-2A]|uniref:helix-turn-helix domain-containing protein n=1 Tax=unclassified Streptomyces TaxID=2593676 RepID=UPI000740EA13|nr:MULTISPECIES: helix-turn-helix transcriptional regulator [unclassified Streptomyces]KUJ38614.1 XRE family transcriptional regulator [Streptomyces sp. NRRL F-5122]MDX3264726.1 helix-turn-helix transcriptional regulator [Streptomyces sp. MI02-2A]REE64493.1 helix-turn-helix protein [Streptomyces sp. 3212.3]
MDRNDLAEFLRTVRERLQPWDVGLPAGTARRTPGLRREEVARLAHISVEYYARLEQGRGSSPSRRVLSELARALRLSADERVHLFELADVAPESPTGPRSDVPATVLNLLEHMTEIAAFVVNARYDVIAWNTLATALFEDFSAVPPARRNLVHRHFLHPEPAARHYGMSGAEEFGRLAVGRLRAAAGRYPTDPQIRNMVETLYKRSPEFAELWDHHHIDSGSHHHKTMQHPVVGTLQLNCDTLAVPMRDQYLVCFTAERGSPSHNALRLLSVVGTQDMTVTTDNG